MKPKAIVLLSGGLDSTTVLAVAKSQGFSVYALSFDYGQRNRFELETARVLARVLGAAEHKCLTIDLREFGGSSLTSELPVEKNRDRRAIGLGVPSTYVPVRNTIFLTYALAWAEVLEAPNIFIGVTAVDVSGYPDCRPEYIEAFSALAKLATKLGTEKDQAIKIHTPLINLGKREIIQLGLSLGVDYGLTNTCYDPGVDRVACGRCDSCTLRQLGFFAAGLTDPLSYKDPLARPHETESK